MSKLTITEALAETKTIDARIAKKQEFIRAHLFRQEQFRDPLEKSGGAQTVIRQERQSISDLEERKLTIRRAIQRANEATEVTIGSATRTIADWLVWRREVAPGRKSFLASLSQTVQGARQEAMKKGLAVLTTSDLATKGTDLLINIDERELSEQIEALETTLGTLDGQLSLKNATTMIEF